MKIDMKLLTSVSALALLALPALARAESITEFLHAFHDDPARMMERLPSEVDKNGVAHPQGYINYDAVDRVMPEKLRLRAKLRQVDPRETALPLPNDLVENFVEPGTSVERQISAQ